MWEKGIESDSRQLPVEAVRDWRLAKMGMPPHIADEIPALRLDWLLAVDDVHNTVEQTLTQKQADEARRAG